LAANPVVLSQAFVQLADSLVDDFDIIDLLTVLSTRCVEIFGAGAAGILLGDQRGTLRVVAASTEQARLLELFQLQSDEGPCLVSYTTGTSVASDDLVADGRWPVFAHEALAVGFRAVRAFPLRLRDEVIGTLNIFSTDAAGSSEEDRQVCQALADVATIAILQNQAARKVETVNGQLQHALDSRVAIEQAKGVLAERLHVDMIAAFEVLRHYARNNNLHLSQVAKAVVDGTLTGGVLTSNPQS
jgi:GAF domain-containing protein